MIAEFDVWVRSQFSTREEHDAESLILFRSMDDRRALIAFWELFDDFMEQRGQPEGEGV